MTSCFKLSFSFLLVAILSCGGGGVTTDGGVTDGIDQDIPVGTDIADPGPVDLADTTDAGMETVDAPDVPEVTDEGGTDDGLSADEGADPCPGGIGCPCKDNGECFSGFCVETMYGGQCASPCDTAESCPQGWTCTLIAIHPDALYVCVDPGARLCKPCKVDGDCSYDWAAGKSLCVELGPLGAFCGIQCEDNQGCPDGFTCVEMGDEREPLKQCLPDDGECPCTDKYIDQGDETYCWIENELGSCFGVRTCDAECDATVPSVEACNTLDDDCDGKTDEDVPSQECSLTNEHGTCTGSTLCVAGEEKCEGLYPSIEVCNGKDDNCDGDIDEGSSDQDEDGIADCVDCDADGDSIPNEALGCPVPNPKDNCPLVNNPGQEDNDGDDQGDVCDPDDDNDGIPDLVDNCPFVLSLDLNDTDQDGLGDVCDCDIDGDGVDNINPNCPDPEPADNCAYLPNPGQEDANDNGIGDVCDGDMDGDGILNPLDNCPETPNPDQEDNENDAIGDVCDPDDDNDGVPDEDDNCPFIANPGQEDLDGDDLGDLCDSDKDGDDIANDADNCPGTYNPDQTDLNSNGVGDACEFDWDGDGIPNGDDNCAWEANPDQADMDIDGQGDVCDCDIDGDGFFNDNPECPQPDPADNCPVISNPDQADMDFDDIGDVCDLDIDGDLDPNDTDCEPENPDVHNGQDETCNGIDDNCDGKTDDKDALECLAFYQDLDKDGYGTSQSQCLCAGVGDYTALQSGDCQDEDPQVNPGVAEKCSEKDDDCDGATDEEEAVGCTAYYRDVDGDTYGLTQDKKCLCDPMFPYSTTQFGDCDDTDATAYPGAIEKCNQRDDNCDGQVDEENAFGCTTFFLDDDDGFGLATMPKCLCTGAVPYDAFTAGDCDDGDPDVNPLADEQCNGKDDDCNGATDEDFAVGCTVYYLDADRDGYGIPGSSQCKCGPEAPYDSTNPDDCNDKNADVHPDAAEICNDLDDDCDGATDEQDAMGCSPFYLDNDGDGFGLQDDSRCLCAASGQYSAPVGGDCNDLNKNIYPDANETCNGKDDDCDGDVDEAGSQGCLTFYLDSDEDSYGLTLDTQCLCAPEGQYTAATGGDCDDGDATTSPGSPEGCTGKDDDCDGKTDEEGADDCTTYYYDGDLDDWGVNDSKCLCAGKVPYVALVAGDCNDNDFLVKPGGVEACNSKDDDCDGAVDEEDALDCATYFYDNDSDFFGLTQNTKCLCQSTGKFSAGVGGDCNDNDSTVYPGATEKCNDADDNCDDTADEEGAIGCDTWYLDNDTDTFGATGQWKCLCIAEGLYNAGKGGDCDDNDGAIYPGSVEVCLNGSDDDCDGKIDEVGCQGCIDFFRDVDDDGYGVDGDTQCLSAPEGHYTATVGGDCKDNDGGVNPAAQEACNGKDDDCDGNVDDENALNCSTYFMDNDTDGFGDPNDSRCLCTAEGKYTTGVANDCNDYDLLVFPGAAESCNGKDDDCDGDIDEENAVGCSTWYKDADDDTYGKATDVKCLCAAAGDYTAVQGGDCNDDDPLAFPGSLEVCANGEDEDCDGQVDEEDCQGCTTYFLDVDVDTWGVSTNTRCLSAPIGSHTATKGGDCADGDAAVNPDATEACNGKDDDCDGDVDEEDASDCDTWFRDNDGDGHGDPALSKCLCAPAGKYTAALGDDCNDNDNAVKPGAVEACNGKDDDCDGNVDEEDATGCGILYLDVDGDLFGLTAQTRCLCTVDGAYTATQGGDCDDGDGAINPGADEVCGNSKDDDCDGGTDEAGCTGCTTYFLDVDDDTWGVSGNTQCLSAPGAGGFPDHTATVGGDCADGDGAVNPVATEACNGKDDDCDGNVDEEDATGCGTYFYDNDIDTYGLTGDSKCLCAAAGKYTAGQGTDCDDADPTVNPAATEACNGKDDDCDTDIDEANATGCTVFFYDNDADTYGDVTDAMCLCAATGKYTTGQAGDCDDDNAAINPDAAEACLNGKDDDCDGEIDEPGCQGCTTFYLDVDDDTWGVTTSTQCLSAATGDYTATKGGDCADGDTAVNPDAVEDCNGKDDDCDGFVDEEDALNCATYFFDNDTDDFGVTTDFKCLCAATGKYTAGVGGDCNDNDSATNPSASESCNGNDDDCDGEVDELGSSNCALFYLDGDGDDYGVNGDTQCLCAAATPYRAVAGGDCDDGDGTVYPGASEACNGEDDNCNGQTDEAGAVGCSIFYKDLDDDDYGVTADTQCLCAESGLYRATVGGDCQDGDGNIHPGAEEICNNKDDDCNNETDEEGATNCNLYYFDNDGDSFGTGQSKCLCSAEGKYSAGTPGDCDDCDGSVFPGALEVCNGHDDDCDTVTDEENAQGCAPKYFDGDVDGWGVTGNSKCLCAADGNYSADVAGDCDDGDGAVNPGAQEVCNGKNDDCDTETDEANATGCSIFYYDFDNDTWGTAQSACLCAASGYYRTAQTGDCLDSNPAVHPGAVETCNGLDDDCNGSTDGENAGGCTTYYYNNDGDSFGIAANKCYCTPTGKYTAELTVDCDDNDQNVFPGATEVCNGKDDDCDGQTDEENATNCADYYYDYDNDNWGINASKCLCAADGMWRAGDPVDCDDNDGTVNPAATEACNGKDDDCDGQTDEEGATGCTQYYYDGDGDGFGSSQWKCLCSTSGNYTATVSGDCCDQDNKAKPNQTDWYTSTNACGSWDYNCSNNTDYQYTASGGGCDAWGVGNGCGLNTGWSGARANCGQTKAYVTGGCGYCCFLWTCCCDPSSPNRTQGCH